MVENREIRIVVHSVSLITRDDWELYKNSPVVPGIAIDPRKHDQALRNASYDIGSYPAAPKSVSSLIISYSLVRC